MAEAAPGGGTRLPPVATTVILASLGALVPCGTGVERKHTVGERRDPPARNCPQGSGLVSSEPRQYSGGGVSGGSHRGLKKSPENKTSKTPTQTNEQPSVRYTINVQ